MKTRVIYKLGVARITLLVLATGTAMVGPVMTGMVSATASVAGVTIQLPQGPTGPVARQTPRPEFEVASIKPAATIGPINTSPGRFVAAGQTAMGLIAYAYGLRSDQVTGGPPWANNDRWEILATMPEDALPRPPKEVDLFTIFASGPRQPDTISLMLQALLDERFQLRVHRETRELPVYELRVAEGGPKIRLSDDQNPLIPTTNASETPREIGPNGLPVLMRGSMQVGGRNPIRFRSKGLPLSVLINTLTNDRRLPVIDKTGLKGLFDIELQWTSDAIALIQTGAPSDVPLLSTALQEQLGLRLVSTKGPVEVLIIDSVEKPAAN